MADCFAREVLEETALLVEVGRLIGVYSNPNKLLTYNDEHRFQLISFNFAVQITGGQLGSRDETTDVGYYSFGEIDQIDVMEHHHIRIDDYFEGNNQMIVR